MVAHATQGEAAFSGLRPINSTRDVAQVAALVEAAFADDMDAAGRTAMREMRWLGRLFGWADIFNAPGQGIMPGFVWVEEGLIVGNVTVRRLSSFGHGWMVGNVAVEPAWRKRGIARRLMEAAIDQARSHQAEWISLQVRSDNAAARGLYQSLGFVDVGETIYLERSHFDRVPPPPQPIEGQLRAARHSDLDRVFMLAQSLVPDTARWAEPVYRSNFDLSLERRFSQWLTGTRAIWRVIQVGDQVWGAAMAQANRWSQRGQLQLWVVSQRTGHVEQILIDSVLAEMDGSLRSMTAHVPGQHVAGRVALAARSFRQVRALTHMKLAISEK